MVRASPPRSRSVVLTALVLLIGTVAMSARAQVIPGDLLAADNGQNLVRFDPGTGALEVLATDADRIGGVEVSAAGEIYVIGLNTVQLFDPSSGLLIPVATGPPLSNQSGRRFIAASLAGDLFVTDINTKSLIRIDPSTGAQSFVTFWSGQEEPIGVVALPNGDLVVSVQNPATSSSTLWRVESASGFRGVFTFLLNSAAAGMAVDPNGDVWVAESAGHRVMKFDGVTGIAGPEFVGQLVDNPQDVAIDETGDLLVLVDAPVRRIVRIDLATTVQTLFATFSENLLAIAEVPGSVQDADLDGVVDAVDNCPGAANPGQGDVDADGVGDACDNCLITVNPGQEDNGGVGGTTPNGVGDACELGDADADGIFDILDVTLLRRLLAGLIP